MRASWELGQSDAGNVESPSFRRYLCLCELGFEVYALSERTALATAPPKGVDMLRGSLIPDIPQSANTPQSLVSGPGTTNQTRSRIGGMQGLHAAFSEASSHSHPRGAPRGHTVLWQPQRVHGELPLNRIHCHKLSHGSELFLLRPSSVLSRPSQASRLGFLLQMVCSFSRFRSLLA